jgi:cellulose synthase/poly-beta-1,6-N-acetylglucosamine synthase-like glycosyltransferase
MLIALIIFYCFALLLVYLSYKSFRGGLGYLEYVRREIAKPLSDYMPYASIFVPCRGLDKGLEENLAALFQQNYPEYEIVFVVDAEDDLSVPVIEKVRSIYPQISSSVIFAGKATDCGQKVHNLREAVVHASDKSWVFVFTDSDARTDKNWLRHLTGPLADSAIGATTGYRWFISNRRNLASEFLSVWNASVASALGANAYNNFCWGGATAITRKNFRELDMREQWRGTVSDDFAVTRAMKEAGLPIHFVPQCLTASFEDCTFAELVEFTTRQMKITRVYAPKLWAMSFIGAFIFNLAMLSGLLLIVSRQAIIFPAIAILLVLIFSTAKSHLRLKAVRLALPDQKQELRKQFLPQNILWAFTPALFFYNCAAAALSRNIIWRGIKYRLDSYSRTTIQ